MDFEALAGDPQAFGAHVAGRLQGGAVDFVEQMRFVRERREAGQAYAASAVLLPLELDVSSREYAVILNKRSDYVQQAGDLCFPGGGMDPGLDRILSRLLEWKILPTRQSGAFRRLLRSSAHVRDLFLFILASVLRESWEEMRLPPWRVEYMGALPTLWMQSFPRVIFPVVGRVRSGWKARPNWEVESVLRVPLRAFLDPANYAICTFLVATSSQESQGIHQWEYPCLVVESPSGQEILWGATFKILMSFIERVFDRPASRIHPSRRVLKELSPYYFGGKERA